MSSTKKHYIGYGGTICTWKDIQKAAAVENAHEDGAAGDAIFSALQARKVNHCCAPSQITSIVYGPHLAVVPYHMHQAILLLNHGDKPPSSTANKNVFAYDKQCFFVFETAIFRAG